MPRMVACSYPRRANCSLAATRIASWLGGEPAGRPGLLRPFRLGVVIARGYMISTFVDISGVEGVEIRPMGMRAIDEINREVPRRSKGRAVLAGVAFVGFGAVGALVVAFIGLVTFGVQATVEPSQADEGFVAVLGTLVALLESFIGRDLTSRVLRDVWPELPPMTSDSPADAQ